MNKQAPYFHFLSFASTPRSLIALALMTLLAACDRQTNTSTQLGAEGQFVEDALIHHQLEQKAAEAQAVNARKEAEAEREARLELEKERLASQERIAAMNAESARVSARESADLRSKSEARNLEAEKVRQAGETERTNIQALQAALGVLGQGAFSYMAAKVQANANVEAAERHAQAYRQAYRKTEEEMAHEIEMQKLRNEGDIRRILASTGAMSVIEENERLRSSQFMCAGNSERQNSTCSKIDKALSEILGNIANIDKCRKNQNTVGCEKFGDLEKARAKQLASLGEIAEAFKNFREELANQGYGDHPTVINPVANSENLLRALSEKLKNNEDGFSEKLGNIRSFGDLVSSYSNLGLEVNIQSDIQGTLSAFRDYQDYEGYGILPRYSYARGSDSGAHSPIDAWDTVGGENCSQRGHGSSAC